VDQLAALRLFARVVANPLVRRTLVVDSPHGRAFHLGAPAARIEGMADAEARALIDRPNAHHLARIIH